jgi:hypothetical protein
LARIGDLGGAKWNHGIRSRTALSRVFNFADIAADRLIGKNVKHAGQIARGCEIKGFDSPLRYAA